jgi:glycosyltransferase involved in cell wall biosynthesis
MKITLVHGAFLPVPALAGGAMEKMWWALAGAFAAAGHEVVSLSRRWPGLPDAESVAPRLRCQRLPGARQSRRLALNLVRDACWSARVLRAAPPADLLVCNTVALPALAPRLRPSLGRVVVSLNRMPKGQLRVYGKVARLIVPSSAVASAVAAAAPQLVARTRLVPNTHTAEPLRQARAAAPTLAPDAPLALGYIGRIHPEKGLALLIDAARRLAAEPGLPAWTLVLRGPLAVAVGGGGPAFAEALRCRAPELFARGQIRIEPPEYAPAALARAYAALDVFVYPSLAERGETFGVAIVEAMSAGAVPVVTDLPCFTDLVTPGRDGLVFARAAPDPAAALAAALASLLRDSALRTRLAAAAPAAVARCELSAVAATLLEDFNTLVPCPPR